MAAWKGGDMKDIYFDNLKVRLFTDCSKEKPVIYACYEIKMGDLSLGKRELYD